MPQELQVLRCFSCKTFQVDIVKKTTKWCCKMCGEKQSIQKIYGKGTGKECRLFVQKMNEKHLTKQTSQLQDHVEDEEIFINRRAAPLKSKWGKFIKSPEALEEKEENLCDAIFEDAGADDEVVTKKRKWAEFLEDSVETNDNLDGEVDNICDDAENKTSKWEQFTSNHTATEHKKENNFGPQLNIFEDNDDFDLILDV